MNFSRVRPAHWFTAGLKCTFTKSAYGTTKILVSRLFAILNKKCCRKRFRGQRSPCSHPKTHPDHVLERSWAVLGPSRLRLGTVLRCVGHLLGRPEPSWGIGRLPRGCQGAAGAWLLGPSWGGLSAVLAMYEWRLWGVFGRSGASRPFFGTFGARFSHKSEAVHLGYHFAVDITRLYIEFLKNGTCEAAVW